MITANCELCTHRRGGGGGNTFLPSRPVDLHFAPTGVHLFGYKFARPYRRRFEDEITEHPRVDELLFTDFTIGIGMGGPF